MQPSHDRCATFYCEIINSQADEERNVRPCSATQLKHPESRDIGIRITHNETDQSAPRPDTHMSIILISLISI